jgi:hypothetical protein
VVVVKKNRQASMKYLRFNKQSFFAFYKNRRNPYGFIIARFGIAKVRSIMDTDSDAKGCTETKLRPS